MPSELEQRMEDLHKRIVVARFRKNDCHVPAGSSAGGQFCETKGGGSHYMPIGEATAQAPSIPKPMVPIPSTPKPTVPAPSPPVKPTGSTVAGGIIKVVAGPGVSSNYTKSVEKRLAAIPDEYRVVPHQNVRIVSAALGSPGKLTATGIFNPQSESRGYVAVTTKGNRGAGQVAETAYHEYGHAVDYHLGGGGGFRSDRADFRSVFNQELAKAGKSINSQFWGTHHREAFAELYKVASGGRITTIGSRATLTQRFPESLAKIKEIVTGRVGG